MQSESLTEAKTAAETSTTAAPVHPPTEEPGEQQAEQPSTANQPPASSTTGSEAPLEGSPEECVPHAAQPEPGSNSQAVGASGGDAICNKEEATATGLTAADPGNSPKDPEAAALAENAVYETMPSDVNAATAGADPNLDASGSAQPPAEMPDQAIAKITPAPSDHEPLVPASAFHSSKDAESTAVSNSTAQNGGPLLPSSALHSGSNAENGVQHGVPEAAGALWFEEPGLEDGEGLLPALMRQVCLSSLQHTIRNLFTFVFIFPSCDVKYR